MMSFEEVVKALEEGSVRVAEKTPEGWKVNSWVKEAILEGLYTLCILTEIFAARSNIILKTNNKRAAAKDF